MIPYARQHLDRDDEKAVAAALASPYLTQGPRVADFEEALASKCGARFAVAVSNGTAALHIAYLAAGIGAGDEVITTPNTFVATTNMLLAVGAKPIFADIDAKTLNLDPAHIERLITTRTKAIVPVHFAGHSADMRAIRALAKKHKLLVIEDAAHALGASYRGSPVGSCRYSDMATMSFHAIKSITTGEGGAVLTNSKAFYRKLCALRSHGIHKDRKGFNVMTSFGFNYRLTDIQAALGLSQLRKLERFITKRRSLAALYVRLLSGISGIVLPAPEDPSVGAWHLFVIRTVHTADRLPLMAHLRKRGIGVNFHYPAVYSHPYYRSFKRDAKRCPRMEAHQKSALTLPLYVDLSEKETAYIAKSIRSYFI